MEILLIGLIIAWLVSGWLGVELVNRYWIKKHGPWASGWKDPLERGMFCFFIICGPIGLVSSLIFLATK